MADNDRRKKLELASKNVKKKLLTKDFEDNLSLYEKLEIHYSKCGEAQQNIFALKGQISEMENELNRQNDTLKRHEGGASAIESILVEEFLEKNPDPQDVDLKAAVEERQKMDNGQANTQKP